MGSISNLIGTATYGHDALGRLTTITNANASSATISQYSYAYDNLNRVTTHTYDSAIGTYTYNGVKTYTYDHTSQVIGDTGSAYSYDAQGNRTMPGYATGAANRLTNDGVFTYAYDAEGNRISKSKGSGLETWYYTWDTRNRLIGVEHTSDGVNILLAVTYTYDANDKLVAEEKWQSSTGVVTTRRHWDGEDLWAITDASNVVSQRLLYGEGVDQIQGRIVEAGPNAGTQGFYATDNLGSVRDIIDAATGEVLYHAEYDAFGGATEYGAGYGDTLKYTARELDADTGLQYNRARWYDNSVGRWLSEDPIGFSAGDHNLYRYVSNFATGATDPSGWYEERKLRADPRFRGLPRIGDSSGGHTGSGNPSGISGAQTDRPGQFPGIGQGGSGHLVRPGQPSYSGGNTQGIILGSPFMAGLGAIGEGVLELFITEQGRATLQWYLVEGLSVVPIIGDIRDVLEFVIGIDFATGEALNWWQRGLTLVGMVIPIIPSSWFRGVGRKVIDFFGGFFKKVPTGLAKPNVIDTKLQNIVNDLYKSGSKIGTGSTADAIRYERATGKPVGGKFHTQKGQEYSQALKKWLEKNPQAPAADRNAAQAILDDLTSALNGN